MYLKCYYHGMSRVKVIPALGLEIRITTASDDVPEYVL